MDAAPHTSSLKITNEILGLIAKIDEFKGAWRAIGRIAPERLSNLRRVATIESIRGGDRAYRIGGDEFLVVMPAQSSNIGETVAQRIASLFRQIPWPHEGVERPTVSIGVATVLGNEHCDADEIVRRADQAMFAAKQAGRDLVMSYHEVRAA